MTILLRCLLFDLCLEDLVDNDREIGCRYGTTERTLSLELEKCSDALKAERVIAGERAWLHHCLEAHVAVCLEAIFILGFFLHRLNFIGSMPTIFILFIFRGHVFINIHLKFLVSVWRLLRSAASTISPSVSISFDHL